MAYLPTTYGTISSGNSNSSLDQTGYSNRSNTAVDGTYNTITLDAGATTDTFTNRVIEIVNGVGFGRTRQFGVIGSYVTGTQVATITTNWTIKPSSGSGYIVHENSGLVRSATVNTITLRTGESSIDDFFNDCYIEAINFSETNHGLRTSQIFKISDYDGTSKTATITGKFDHIPDINTIYIIYEEGGLATSGSTNTITLDGNQSNAVIAGLQMRIVSGTGIGQNRQIASITDNVVTLSS